MRPRRLGPGDGRGFGCPLGSLRATEGGKSSVNRKIMIIAAWTTGMAVAGFAFSNMAYRRNPHEWNDYRLQAVLLAAALGFVRGCLFAFRSKKSK